MPDPTTTTTPTTNAAPQMDAASEIEQLKRIAETSPMPAALRDKLEKMLMRLQRMTQLGSYAAEYESVEQYIRWIVQIPWGKYSQDNLDLANAQQKLDKEHFGLQQVKSMVLEYLAVMKLQMQMRNPVPVAPVAPSQPTLPATLPETQPTQALPVQVATAPGIDVSSEMSRLQGSASHAPIMCFVGIQGVGKTSIAKSIANALGRKFIRVSLGALGNVSQIRGTARTEPGAEPGQIIKALVRSGTMNPLILLDEIDKTSSETGLRADLMAALLEILDPEQNATFVDHYLDYPVDLSACMFITTANNLGGISAALLDRLEIVRFGSYTDEEKVAIAKDYMLPRVREATGLTPAQLDFAPDVWPLVVRPLGFDAGVRQLERTLTMLARKVAMQIVEGKTTGVKIDSTNFRDYLPEDIGVYS